MKRWDTWAYTHPNDSAVFVTVRISWLWHREYRPTTTSLCWRCVGMNCGTGCICRYAVLVWQWTVLKIPVNFWNNSHLCEHWIISATLIFTRTKINQEFWPLEHSTLRCLLLHKYTIVWYINLFKIKLFCNFQSKIHELYGLHPIFWYNNFWK
jgi:hypothetical protein